MAGDVLNCRSLVSPIPYAWCKIIPNWRASSTFCYTVSILGFYSQATDHRRAMLCPWVNVVLLSEEGCEVDIITADLSS